MLYEPQFLYRLKLIFIYLIVKLDLIHPILPKSFRDELPTGWNNQMFWTAFKSGGTKLYFSYACKLDKPNSYEPKVVVKPQYQLTEAEIRFFYENGYIGPFELMSPEKMAEKRENLIKIAGTESNVFSYARGDYKFVADTNGKVRSLDELSQNEKYYVNILKSYERYLDTPVILDLFKHPAITERCAQILGPDLVIWHNNHFFVEPQTNGSAWHQTSRWFSFDMKEPLLYPKNEKEIPGLTCWIAISDVPENRACLALIPGTQKEIYPVKLKPRKDLESNEGRVFGRYDKYHTQIDYPIDSKQVKALPAKAGQFYLFSERTIHGATDNTTDERRCAIGGRIAKADTKVFTEKMLKNGLNIEIYGVRNLKLDKWKPALIRGKDLN